MTAQGRQSATRAATQRTPDSAEGLLARALEPAAGYQPLVLVVVAAAGGIIMDRVTAVPGWAWGAAGVAAWCAWWRYARREQWRASAVLLLAAVTALGATWHHARWHLFNSSDVSLFTADASQPVCLEAIASGTPQRVPAPAFDPLRSFPTGDSSRLEVAVVRIRDGETWRSSSGAATLIVEGHLLGVHAGDRLRIFGQLFGPTPVLNPGQFDFAAYARGDRRMALVRTDHPDAVTVTSSGSWLRPARWIDEMRRYGDTLLRREVDPSRAPLAAALTLGLRRGLDREQTESFVQTGTMDLLSISGLHIGMLAGALFLALRFSFVPRRAALVAIALVTLAYALLTGAEPPIIRATVMVLVVCLGLALARRSSTLNTLAAAALVVLALNPTDLFRTGPQLSFLAMCVLAWSVPRIWRWPQLDPLDRLIVTTRSWSVRLLRNARIWTLRTLAVSAAIWLVMLPLIAARFHVVSPIGILLHPLLMLPVAGALLSGFGMLVFGWLVPPVAVPLAAVCNASLAAIDAIVGLGESVPGGHFHAAGPGAWWLVGYYALLAAALLLPGRRPPLRWCASIGLAWIGLGFGAAALGRAPADQLRCTFIAVGHGTAVLIELPGGETLLYDAGRLGSPEGATRDVAGVLWQRGIRHLDAIIVSHADVDHFNGVPGLLERFSCGTLLTTRSALISDSTAARMLWDDLQAAAVPVRELRAGDRLRTGGPATIDVWHPPRQVVLGSDNANSVVLSIEYGGRRIFLTGDLESPGLEALFAEAPYDTDVLLAPHHGSARSDPPGFSTWATPEWVIVSGGHSDELAPVRRDYESGGARVLHTAVDGAVEFTIGPSPAAGRMGELSVRSHRRSGMH